MIDNDTYGERRDSGRTRMRMEREARGNREERRQEELGWCMAGQFHS